MKEQKRRNRRTVNFYLLGLEQWLETFQKKFTDSYIHGIKPTNKEQLFSDRDNLYLLVKQTGAKIWRFIYTHPITKKRIKKSFGNYPSIPLAFARDKARILVYKTLDEEA